MLGQSALSTILTNIAFGGKYSDNLILWNMQSVQLNYCFFVVDRFHINQ